MSLARACALAVVAAPRTPYAQKHELLVSINYLHLVRKCNNSLNTNINIRMVITFQ